MKIMYDHQVFSINKYGGVGKYFCELIKNLPPGFEYNLSVITSNNQHLKDNFSFFRKIYLPISTKQTRIGGRLRTKNYELNKWYSKKTISSGAFDILHPTYFNPYFLSYTKKPYVITVHDLIAYKYKELYKDESLRENMAKCIRNARRIISISENTKKDLIEILNIKPDKIDVVYHGFNPTIKTASGNPHGRYILYVAARWGYKNFTSLAKAFSGLVATDPDLKLICVGPSFSTSEIAELKKLKIFKNAMAMGVNEEKLNELYSHALAFVYPSMYEGFGMSILEAFANNCPVCLSNTSSLPEVAGNAGAYFDPSDTDSIFQTVKKVISDTEYANQMVKAGNDRLRKFSWRKCAEETILSYEKALS